VTRRESSVGQVDTSIARTGAPGTLPSNDRRRLHYKERNPPCATPGADRRISAGGGVYSPRLNSALLEQRQLPPKKYILHLHRLGRSLEENCAPSGVGKESDSALDERDHASIMQ
jgi:hypothetical protein